MDPQLKKGVLGLVVLESVRKKDVYEYEPVEEVSKVIDVNEGITCPLLRRLANERYLKTYLGKSTEGPPRKYYHIIAAGVLHHDRLERERNESQEKACVFLKEQKDG